MKTGLPSTVIARGSRSAGQQPADVLEVVLLAVGLRLEDVLFPSVPATRPRLVRPAEAEREVGLAGREHLVERPLEQPLPAEPVVVVAERLDAGLARERGLRLP